MQTFFYTPRSGSKLVAIKQECGTFSYRILEDKAVGSYVVNHQVPFVSFVANTKAMRRECVALLRHVARIEDGIPRDLIAFDDRGHISVLACPQARKNIEELAFRFLRAGQLTEAFALKDEEAMIFGDPTGAKEREFQIHEGGLLRICGPDAQADGYETSCEDGMKYAFFIPSKWEDEGLKALVLAMTVNQSVSKWAGRTPTIVEAMDTSDAIAAAGFPCPCSEVTREWTHFGHGVEGVWCYAETLVPGASCVLENRRRDPNHWVSHFEENKAALTAAVTLCAILAQELPADNEKLMAVRAALEVAKHRDPMFDPIGFKAFLLATGALVTECGMPQAVAYMTPKAALEIAMSNFILQ